MERKSMFFGGLPRTPYGNINRPSHVSSTQRRDRFGSTTGRESLANDIRHSIAGGAASMGCRPSVIPGASKKIMVVPKIRNDKDERNLRDPHVQSSMIAKIVIFLADCYNPHPPFNFEGSKFLKVPNRNDFKNVFEFIFQNIQPAHQVKNDEEVVKLMKNLGFPYPLKTSHMQTMTTAQTWPTMLSVLEWLVDMVELENSVHNDNAKIGDMAKWNLLTSCYKRVLETKGLLKSEIPPFEQEFNLYRQSKLGEGEDGDAFDEMRARRVACEEKLKMVQMEIEQANNKIITVENAITDCQEDIKSLEKYIADSNLKTSQIEQMMVPLHERHDSLLQTIKKFNEENEEKERKIAAQKISGNQARQLITKRSSVREEIGLTRERLGQLENKHFDLQTKSYKLSAKVQSDYSTLIYGIRALCEYHDINQQTISWLDQHNFDEAYADFQNSGHDNRLSKLIGHLKQLSEQRVLAHKHSEASTAQSKANISKEIRELQSQKEQRVTQQELEIQRAQRERDDKIRPELDLKHNLDVVKQKHKATTEALNKYTTQLNGLHEELAEKHKKYLDYKRQLDMQYHDLQALVLEKMMKLWDHFQLIKEQKQRFKELGEHILAANLETQKKLRTERK